MNELEITYLNMFGLKFNPIIETDNYTGIISKNDIILGYSKKKGKEVELILDERKRDNCYVYNRLNFKELKNQTVNGTMIISNDKETRKLNYLYNPLFNEHTIEFYHPVDTIQLNFNNNIISAIVNDKQYNCCLTDSYSINSIDKEVIVDLILYYYEYVPELIQNIVNSNKTKTNNFNLYINNEFDRQEKIKQLII